MDNKFGFRLENRFAPGEIFKFFITEDKLRTDEFSVISMLLPSNSLRIIKEADEGPVVVVWDREE